MNRLEDEALIAHVLTNRQEVRAASVSTRRTHAMVLRNFTKALVEKDATDSLGAFIRRLRISKDRQDRWATEEGLDPVAQLDEYLRPFRSGDKYGRRQGSCLASGLEFLAESGDDHASTSGSATPLPDHATLRTLLPPHERDLIKSVELRGKPIPALVVFSSRLLLDGHGGLGGWLGMYKDGREGLARSLLTEKFGTREREALAAIQSLQRSAGVAPDLIVPSDGMSGCAADEREQTCDEAVSDARQEPFPQRMTPTEAVHALHKEKDDFPAQANPMAMSPEHVGQWHRNRLEDDALINHVLIAAMEALGASRRLELTARKQLRDFATSLANADPNDSLSAFLKRSEDLQGDEWQEKKEEVAAFLERFGDSHEDRLKAHQFKSALTILRHIPAEERNAERSGSAIPLPALLDSMRLRTSLPAHERALIAKAEVSHSCASLVRFSSTLLLEGYGGLTGWLAMHKDGRAELARKLLVEKFGPPGNRDFAAIDALQEDAGIDPAWRIRIKGVLSYVAAPSIGMQPGVVRRRMPGDTQSRESEAGTADVTGGRMRTGAVQWFRNRKDDAILIDSVYRGRCGGSPVGALELRRFTKAMLDADRDATLRAFLRRFESSDADERKIAHDEVNNFGDDAWLRGKLSEALNALVENGYDDPEIGADEFDIFSRSGTTPRQLLPPDDQSLMDFLLEDAAYPQRTNYAHMSAALRIAIALLERGIGGLAEWLAMQRDDAPPQEKAEAKMLLDSCLSTCAPFSSGGPLAALGRLQELKNVDRGYRIGCSRRGRDSTSTEEPVKRQRREGTSTDRTAQSDGQEALRKVEPWKFDLAQVPRRPRTRGGVVVDQPRGGRGV
ncbi:MAG TPA: hypothetical protein VFP68_23240, partial [Burkholderiaceae bacterium]|nr:hypothetical protein [Burkholderiaceae bacterium]